MNTNLNRRDLLRTGAITIGAVTIPMVIPMRSVFALTDPRSLTVVKGIERFTGKPYADVTEDDLKLITGIELPHVHIDSFFEADFTGFTNLAYLRFLSVFHYVPGLPETIFRTTPALERLNLDRNQFTAFPDDVFSPLEQLKVLEIHGCAFENIPSSLLHLPSIESVKTDGGLPEDQMAALRNAYGDRVSIA